MSLSFNLRLLEHKVLHLLGEWPVDEMDLADMDELVQILEPLHYELWVEKFNQSVLVIGRLQFTFDCHCSRCLQQFQKVVEIADWNCNLPLEGEEKVLVKHDCVDLTPFIREDILLAFPQHPLCHTECSGLPIATPQYPNAGATSASGVVPSAWDELNKLKF